MSRAEMPGQIRLIGSSGFALVFSRSLLLCMVVAQGAQQLPAPEGFLVASHLLHP